MIHASTHISDESDAASDKADSFQRNTYENNPPGASLEIRFNWD